MRHCPQCQVNYADKFTECFTCRGELAAGEIEERAPAGRRAATARGGGGGGSLLKIASGLSVLLLCGYFLSPPQVAAIPEPVLPVLAQDTALQFHNRKDKRLPQIHRARAGTTGGSRYFPREFDQERVSKPAVLRDPKEAPAFTKRTGVAIPAFEAGREMVLVCPVEYYQLPKVDPPHLAGLTPMADGLEVAVDWGVHTSMTPRDRELLQARAGGKSEPVFLKVIDDGREWGKERLQYVIVARVPLVDGGVTYKPSPHGR